ncbi:hypothetical protein B0H13DRAFT_1855557 [Mycena leptocephala]|nr:hypothetical protein B0H13DRAFT_1855557 [Mycena leptocephala]
MFQPKLKTVDPEGEKSIKQDDLARFLTPHLTLLLFNLNLQLSFTQKLQIAGIMAGYQKPRLHGHSTLRLLISTLLGLSLNFFPWVKSLETFYLSVYMACDLTIFTVVLGQLFFPAPGIKPSQLFDVSPHHFRRFHVSHMRIDCLRRCPGYQDPRLSCYSFSDFLTVPRRFLSAIMAIPQNLHPFWATQSTFETHRYSADQGPFLDDSDSDNSESNDLVSMNLDFGHDPPPNPAPGTWTSYLLQGRFGSANAAHVDDSDQDELDSEGPRPSGKRKRKARPSKPRKSTNKGKGKARAVSDSEADLGIRVTMGKGKDSGIYVDEVVDIYAAPETWDVSPSDHRVAFILNVTNSPELPDSFTGPTGSRDVNKLAEVLILDDDIVIDCPSDFLEDFERLEGNSEDLISAPIRAAKSGEAGSLISIASEFHQSVTSKYCKGRVEDENFACGGHAIIRKYTKGRVNGKSYFIGCSNWSKNNFICHRFRTIPHSVRESILGQIFREEEVEVEDDDVVTGPCR